MDMKDTYIDKPKSTVDFNELQKELFNLGYEWIASGKRIVTIQQDFFMINREGKMCVGSKSERLNRRKVENDFYKNKIHHLWI